MIADFIEIFLSTFCLHSEILFLCKKPSPDWKGVLKARSVESEQRTEEWSGNGTLQGRLAQKICSKLKKIKNQFAETFVLKNFSKTFTILLSYKSFRDFNSESAS